MLMALITLACGPEPSETDWPSPTVGYDGEDSRPPPPDDTGGEDGFSCLDDVSWTVIGVRVEGEEWMEIDGDAGTMENFRLGVVNEAGSDQWLGEACIDGVTNCHVVGATGLRLGVVATTETVELSETTFFGWSQFEQTSWVLHDGEGRCSTSNNHATVYRDAGCCAQPLD